MPPQMAIRLTLDYADEKPDFARRLPVTGRVEQSLRAKDGQAWQWLRLEHPVELDGGLCGSLLIRRWDAQSHTEGSDAFRVDVLRAPPQIKDGFDAAIFESLGSARAHPARAPVSSGKQRWTNIALIAAILAFAGWLLWCYDDAGVLNRFVVRVVAPVVLELLSHLR
jgi:hypothetical protein